MNVTLWILASLLAAVFVAVVATKLTTPREKLIPKMASVADYSDSQVKVLAAVEVLGAGGLILPALLDIAPILMPIAATGLAVMMVGAVAVHLRRGDGVPHAIPAIVGVLAVIVAAGRFGPEQF